MNTPTAAGRGRWGSSLGFILAAAGSAIGLGNIWGFPYMAAQSGGAAFVLVYLLCVALVGIPVMFAELSIGRASQRNPVGAFKRLRPGTPWWAVGALGVISGFAILSFYSVIAGWTVGYLFKAARGDFATGLTMEQSRSIFETFSGDPVTALICTAVFFALTILVVQGGVHGGIERASQVLMPIFFILLVALAIRAVTLPGGYAGVRYLFNADFHKLTPTVVLRAMAQAFFSLSLGMGAMITYGSYLSRQENLPAAGVTVALADTAVALLAGLMIFPAIFAAGAKPAGSVGLVFHVLPTVFDTLPAGRVFAVAFYALLVIAALTSSISLLEVVVAFFVDELGVSRRQATWLIGLACFALAVPSAVSGRFMDWVVTVFYNYALAVGALLICLFVGWAWTPKSAIEEMTAEGQRFWGLAFWGVLIRYVCPLLTAAILYLQISESLG